MPSPDAPVYEPTNVYDEYFSDECGTVWLVKSDRTPTRNVARKVVAEIDGALYIDTRCRSVQAVIEWRDVEGWWLTVTPDGPYEVWEVTYD